MVLELELGKTLVEFVKGSLLLIEEVLLRGDDDLLELELEVELTVLLILVKGALETGDGKLELPHQKKIQHQSN